MKLLWYADAIYYKRHGHSMTGLVYEHMTYGALPIGFNELLNVPTIEVIEEMIYEDISYKIIPKDKVLEDIFAKQELNVLKLVASEHHHPNKIFGWSFFSRLRIRCSSIVLA